MLGIVVIAVGSGLVPVVVVQALGGQVFRLVGIDEDLSQYEQDIMGDEERNTKLVTAVCRTAEQSQVS